MSSRCLGMILTSKLIFIVALVSSGCGKNDENITEDVLAETYVSVNDFDQFKLTEIQTIQSEINSIKQSILDIDNNVIGIGSEIDAQSSRLNNAIANSDSLIESDKQSRIEISAIETDLTKLRNEIASIKLKAKPRQSKLVKPTFSHKVMGISRWGSVERVYIQLGEEYVFGAIGDVIQQWRIDEIDFNKRTVSMVHNSGARITRIVQ